MELETVMSYIANSINPDGVRTGDHRGARGGHNGGARARAPVRRADQGAVRRRQGSLDFNAEQSYLQPPDEQTDIVHVIKGVIEAESGAIEHYN